MEIKGGKVNVEISKWAGEQMWKTIKLLIISSLIFEKSGILVTESH
jgi:hypothetical protein